MYIGAATSIAKTSQAIPECSYGLLPLHRKLPLSLPAHVHMKRPKRGISVRAASSRDSKNGSGIAGRPSMVDADMLVLRRRMHQLRMEEINYIPPQHWMEWEKRWYASYDSDVCASLVWLQSILLNTRPSIAMSLLVLISCSVPAFVLLLVIHASIHVRGIGLL